MNSNWSERRHRIQNHKTHTGNPNTSNTICGEVTYLHGIKHIINPLNAELNPICHLLALVGARHILHVSGVRVKTVHF
jgi:hypothetical protein